MAKIYNIMNKLTNERPIVQIDEKHEYKINNTKNNAVYIQALVKESKKDKEKNKDVDEIKLVEKIIIASLGKEAFDYIESLELSMEGYNVIINAIMAGISNSELEEIEEMEKKEIERFQQEDK